MFLPRKMKTVFGKMGRSGFFYFIMTKLPVRRASETETALDVLGVVLVVSLSAATVFLMRFLLIN